MPVSVATSRTWRMSPRAKASTIVVGMMLRRKATVSCACAACAPYSAAACTSAGVAVMLMPTPGCRTLTTTSPMISASVDTTSK